MATLDSLKKKVNAATTANSLVNQKNSSTSTNTGTNAAGIIGSMVTGAASAGLANSNKSSSTTSSKSSGSGGTYVATTSNQKNPYENPQYTQSTGLTGVSSSTMAGMSGGYAPSQAVTEALAYLNSLKQNAPGEYSDPYADQLNSLYQQIVNRPDFSYDLNGDMLYKQYAQQYQQMGQQAMQDTMGQAAALTGGYGSSYTSTAGNQAYQGYLQQLNSMIPQLYQLAMQKYQMEGDNLNTKFATTQGMSEQDYARYLDMVNRYYTDLTFATDAYNNERTFDYGQYADNRDWSMQMAQMEMSNAASQRQYAYKTAMAMLEAGIQPSDALLGAAGISEYDAWAIKNSNAAPTYTYVPAYTGSYTTSTTPSSSAAQQSSGASANSFIQSVVNAANSANKSKTTSKTSSSSTAIGAANQKTKKKNLLY